MPLLLESHGHLAHDLEVMEKLLMISSATIARLLAPVRKTSPGNGGRRPPRAHSAGAAGQLSVHKRGELTFLRTREEASTVNEWLLVACFNFSRMSTEQVTKTQVRRQVQGTCFPLLCILCQHLAS